MKLLVLALTPPPHHGQSYMVQMMIEGFGGDQRKHRSRKKQWGAIDCYHVNARFADDFQDMGTFRPRKALRLIRYIVETIWCRFRYDSDVLFYCPAPPVKATLTRDIILLMVLRPFFRKTVFFWHAAGLGEWVDSGSLPSILALGAKFSLKNADLAITPSKFNLPDALRFQPKRALAIPNGIPDPCPDFAARICPLRANARGNSDSGVKSQRRIEILFMALCTEEKGLWDSVEALNLLIEEGSHGKNPLCYHLTVAGKFLNKEEERQFWLKVKSLRMEDHVTYAGFISGEAKRRLMEKSDVFCFPTYYSAESFPIVLIEAMAYGLPIVTTRWRSLSEFLPPDYPGIVAIRNPAEVAQAIRAVLAADYSGRLRELFLQNYTIEQHLQSLAESIKELSPGSNASQKP